ncbi:hypothetical protein BH24CHL5_BH24CHL5_10050 [soil metagenome]
MRRSATIPALLASVAIGIALLAAPDALGLTGAARLAHIIVGPLVASLAVIALWPVGRLVVRANVLLGVAVALAPMVADFGGWMLEPVVAGTAIALLALIPRSEAHRFGGGWGSLFKEDQNDD